MEPKKRCVLITGTSRGIGAATAKRLLNEGWEVHGISRTDSPLLSQFNTFHQHAIDLEKLAKLPEQLSALKEKIPPLDALVLNAGKGVFGHLEQFSYAQIDTLFHLNLLSTIYLARTFIPEMKRRKEGSIIFMGSEAALQGKQKGAIYCASKFAIRGFAQALRDECAKSHIRVSLINPGMVDTSFFEHLEFSPGEDPSEHIIAEDLAETVSFLLNGRKGTVIDEINMSPQSKKIRFENR